MAKTKAAGIASPDANWRAESDMRTLIDAQIIRDDPKRLKAAQAAAKKQADALEDVMDPNDPNEPEGDE